MATLALANTMTDPCNGTSTSCNMPYTPVAGLYTYGSPRVGSRSFVNAITETAIDRTPLFRFVHDIPADGYDLVTAVPTSPPYSHLTTSNDETEFEVFLQDAPMGANGQPSGPAPPPEVSTLPTLPTGARPSSVKSLKLALQVHAIVNYVNVIGGSDNSLVRGQ